MGGGLEVGLGSGKGMHINLKTKETLPDLWEAFQGRAALKLDKRPTGGGILTGALLAAPAIFLVWLWVQFFVL